MGREYFQIFDGMGIFWQADVFIKLLKILRPGVK